MDKKLVSHMAYAPLGQGSRNKMFQEPVVLALAENYGKTPAQVLLRFLTQKGIAVIPRSTKPEHIKENFGKQLCQNRTWSTAPFPATRCHRLQKISYLL